MGRKDEDLTLIFTFFNEINIIAQLSSNAFDRSLPDNLNQSQFSVLNWFIRVDSIATPGRLATAFMVTRGAMTNTLKKLSKKGYISVQPDESSGRRKLVTITGKGRLARDQAIKRASPLMREIAGQFPVRDMRRYLEGLQTIRKYMDERRYRTGTG